MKQHTQYQVISRLTRRTALVCAAVAGIGSSIGLHEMQPSGGWFIPVLAGVGICTVLGVGWHLVISGAEKARTKRGILGVIGGGLMLAGVAVGSSGWALVTAISGGLASQAHMEGTLESYEESMRAVHARIERQAVIPDLVSQAAATYGALARDEESGRIGPSGCGKRCIAYQDVEANYNRLGNGLATMIEEARSSEGSGRAALNNARHAVMTADQDAFREALLKAGSVIGSLKDFDLSTRIERTGLIDVSLTDELGQLGRIDEDLRQKARQIAANAEPIAVPVFRPISKGEAVIRYFDRVIAAVFLALGIDIAPFLLAMLILAFAYEPLMRDIDPGDDDAHKDQATRIAADESSVIRAQFATTER